MTINRRFFAHKKPWSKIKDEVLTAYLMPYLRKVSRRGNRILIADCFAGKGKFDDGAPGSPLLIADAVRSQLDTDAGKGVKLVCIEKRYYQELKAVMSDYDFVSGLDGDYEARMAFFLSEYPARGQNLFLYVDPYGIKSLRFQHFAEVGRRGYSTVELLLNLNTFGFLREGCRLLKKRDLRSEDISEEAPEYECDVDNAAALDEVAGGEYWRAIIESYYAGQITFREAEEEFGNRFCDRLQAVFRHVLMMPIKTRLSNIPKYRIIYGTNHAHGVILMADSMCKRWRAFREEQRGGQQFLFELDHPTNVSDPSPEAMRQAILDCLPARRELSELLVCLINRFGVNYSESDYRSAIKELNGGPLCIEHEPAHNPETGRACTGLDYKNKHYRVYLSRSSTWQQDLL